MEIEFNSLVVFFVLCLRGNLSVMLEVKALREGAWKMACYTANHTDLVMKVSLDLKKLLKLSKYAHPEL